MSEYEIEPPPASAAERAAIIAALEQLADEQAEPAPWSARARREIVDDGIA